MRTAVPRLGMVLEQTLAPVPGGTGRYALELTRALVQSGDQRTVRTFTAWHRDTGPAVVEGADGPHRLPLGHRGLVAAWERGLPPLPWGVDLIHAPTLLVPWRARVPKVVTIHDTVPWSHPDTLTERGVRWHRAQAERAARQAAAIIVPTRAVRDELTAVLDIAGPVEVIGSAVSAALVVPDDVPRLAAGPLPPRYVVAVATAEPRKGLDILIQALAAPACQAVPLVVVGQPGWGGVDVSDLARRHGVDASRVVVTGRLDDTTLAAVVAGADLLVMPSRSEGFGIPVIEAMHLGTAVIHSDVPALVEVADGAGVCVPREDPDALARAVAECWEQPRRREECVTRGRRVAAGRTWAAVAEAHWQVYERALTA